MSFQMQIASSARPSVLIIDNYDSFVHTIARYFAELGAAPTVVRNDAIDAAGVEMLAPDAIVVSPGPRAPKDAGQSLRIVRSLSGVIPILGICLGHQCIGAAFGGRVKRAREPMHGRSSTIVHDGSGLFAGLPNAFRAARYHSLVVELPPPGVTPLEVNALSEGGEIMAMSDRDYPTYGLQFHPESVLTEHGHAILDNFLQIALRWHRHHGLQVAV